MAQDENERDAIAMDGTDFQAESSGVLPGVAQRLKTVGRGVGKVLRWGFPGGGMAFGVVPVPVRPVFAESLVRAMLARGDGRLVRWYTIVLIIAALQALGVGIAFAADAVNIGTLLKSNPDSLAIQWLVNFFGPIPTIGLGGAGGSAGAGGGTVATKALEVLNALCLALGGFWVLYSFVAAVAQTAHEGEPLGRRWSSLWVPIRLPIGVGMLAPVAHGLSVAQLVAIWLAVMGNNVANGVWDRVVDTIATGSAPIAANSIETPVALMRFAARAAACSAAVNASFQNSGPTIRAIPGSKSDTQVVPAGIFTSAKTITTTTTTVSFGVQNDNDTSGISEDACGRLAWTSSRMISSSDGSTVNRSVVVERIDVEAARAHAAAIQTLAQSLLNVGVKIVAQRMSSGLPSGPLLGSWRDLSADITQSITTYKADLSAHLNGALAGADTDLSARFKAEAKKAGWLYAGVWFNDLVAMQGRVAELAKRQPAETTGASLRGVPDSSLPAARAAMAMADYIVNNALGQEASAPDPILVAQMHVGPAEAARGDAMGTLSDSEVEGLLVSKIRKPVADLLTKLSVGSNDPIASLGNLGLVLANVGGAIAIGASIASALPGGGIVTALMGLVNAFASLFFLAGTVLSVVVPMVPWLMWSFGVVGWLCVCLEAVVGATLWALAHLSMEGEGIEGARGSAGYMLLLNLFLRPTLMIIGFLFAVMALNPVVKYVGSGMISQMQSIVPNSLTSIVLLVGYSISFCSVMVSALYTTFGLINQVPDKVLSWIGGDGRGETLHGKEAVGIVGVASKPTDLIGRVSPRHRDPDPKSGGKEADGRNRGNHDLIPK